ncbi:uncharacterized protein LOC141588528 [Silene latifolia]|uniref:uncharacterized protein LOC141588528 n=1 Tax=Silene latifolia TaxID=37657 RepID=UPI003D782406
MNNSTQNITVQTLDPTVVSIDYTDPNQFPPLSSTVHKPIPDEPPVTATGPVVSGPGDEAGNKTVDVNQLTRRKGKQPLQSIQEEPEDLIQFSDEDVKDELEYWKNSVYGFVLGANPPVEVVEGFLRRLWATYPIDKVSFCANGIFLVRFKTSAAKDQILRHGHFLFDNKPLIVREWTADVTLEKEEVKEVPVWVKILNLPLKFWGKCLPRIAGLLGKFVRCDEATEAKTRLGFARVMIDVPFGKPIPDDVKFMDTDGSVVSLKVEFEWKPLLCTQCKGIGHESSK